MLDDEAKYLPQAEDSKHTIKSNGSATKESVDVYPYCIVWFRGGPSEESDPTKVQIQSIWEEEVIDGEGWC